MAFILSSPSPFPPPLPSPSPSFPSPSPTVYTKENNYLYAIPLKHFYSDKIHVGTRSNLSPYHITYTKGCHLFCTAPLDGQFLRVAVAVKTKVNWWEGD